MNEIHYLFGNRCDLTCDFCFWDMQTPDVPWETKKRIVDEIKETGVERVTISGGEPTCARDFVRALKYMSDSGLRVVLHTHGLNIDKGLAKKIAPLVERVSLSLDGSSKGMCLRMRKTSRLVDHTLFLIDLFFELGVSVSVKTLVTKVNINDIFNIGMLLRDKSVLYWSLLEFNPINRGRVYESKFLLEDAVFDSIVEKVRREFTDLKIKVRMLKRKPQTYCFIASNGKAYTYVSEEGNVLIGDLQDTKLSKIISQNF